ncbi:hypothetical protein Tco_0523517 [Tanacetum coccineum]
MGLWYPNDIGFKLTAFSDADHTGCLDTHKSNSGGIQFLAEVEYVALSASCAQAMWMRTQLKDYGFDYNKIPLTEYQLADMFTKALPEDRVMLFSIHTDKWKSFPCHHQTALRGSYALSWKPCQGDSSKLNLPDHRSRRWCSNLIPAESDSLPHAHAQATKTYNKHQDSRIKNQES